MAGEWPRIPSHHLDRKQGQIMARRIRHPSLETRTSRLKLLPRGKPYRGPKLARGLRMDYRRNSGNGTWIAVGAMGRAADGKDRYWNKGVGQADDFDDADGKRVLTFFQGCDATKQLALKPGADAGVAGSAPISVDSGLKAYEDDLKARGADVYNAKHPRAHLTAALLARPIMLLTVTELKKWRDSLLGKISPATINRICNSLCAALELAAQHDDRIQNRTGWERGLEGLPDAQRARNVVISDAHVRAFVTEAYARDAGLGLLVEVLAETGTRPSQAIRLCVDELQDHLPKPKVLMPKSGKGGGRNRSQQKHERYSVPVSAQLARKLRQAALGRPGEAPLLLQSDGQPWSSDPSADYRSDVHAIVKAIGLDPEVVTMYALRHSNITRMLLAGWPIRLVASLHNTSVGQIERNYSRYITEHSDDYTPAALLDEAPAVDNVVPMVR